MAKVLITDIVARSAKPATGKQFSIWDTATRGFGLRVNPQGTKTWQVMLGDERKRLTLGRYPDMSLKEARTLAHGIIANGGVGEPAKPKRVPFVASDAVAKFIELHHAGSRPGWRKEQQRLLTKHFLSKYADLPLDKFTSAHVLSVTDSLAHIPSEQIHVHRALKTFFKWAYQRQLIPASPIASLPMPGKAKERERLLSDAELARIYKAAIDLGNPFGFIVLVCIHTGLRRGEVGSLRWSYISPEFITIPKHIAKNGREHTIPNLINDNFALIPKTSEFVFPTANDRPFAAWGRHKARLDALCGVEDFVLHDFRRYLSSTMRRLGVPIDVTETILNHVSGSRSQIQRIYDRHDRLPEMREALTLYEQHLAAINSAK
jgi:integrase